MNVIEQLSRCVLFRELKDDLPPLALPSPVTFGKGEEIYGKQHYTRALGVVLSGKAVACPLGKSRGILARFETGDVFGVAAMFGNTETYVSRIVAQTDCTVQFLDESVLRELFEKRPDAAVAYISFLSRKIRFLNGKVAALSQNEAVSRVYTHLTQVCDENGMVAEHNMSRLAKTLSMGRTSLYRVLEELEQKNMIVREDRKIKVIV